MFTDNILFPSLPAGGIEAGKAACLLGDGKTIGENMLLKQLLAQAAPNKQDPLLLALAQQAAQASTAAATTAAAAPVPTPPRATTPPAAVPTLPMPTTPKTPPAATPQVGFS